MTKQHAGINKLWSDKCTLFLMVCNRYYYINKTLDSMYFYFNFKVMRNNKNLDLTKGRETRLLIWDLLGRWEQLRQHELVLIAEIFFPGLPCCYQPTFVLMKDVCDTLCKTIRTHFLVILHHVSIPILSALPPKWDHVN